MCLVVGVYNGRPTMATRKQAVLLIHGIGDQKPMDTLRGFVEAVWTQDSAVHHPFVPATVWSKPDLVSDSFELRRLTTPRNKAGIRTHFNEFYWAHLIQDTTLSHVLGAAASAPSALVDPLAPDRRLVHPLFHPAGVWRAHHERHPGRACR